MQLVNIKNLYLSELGANEKIEISDDISDYELTDGMEAKTAKGVFKLTRLDESLLVVGSVEADVIAICDRCLDSFPIKVNFDVEREFLFDRKAKDCNNLKVDKYLNIDLSEPIREELILALPMKKVCSEECKGICSGCGENLNYEKCRCKAKTA